MERWEIAQRILADVFGNVGEPDKEALKQLKVFEEQRAQSLLPNSFQFTVHLYGKPRLARFVQLDHHLNQESIDYRGYFNLIHEEWFMLYLLFGKASYVVSREYEAELLTAGASSQIKVPLIINDRRKYVWYNQVSLPAAMDEQGNLAAHVNIYQLDRHYDVNHLVTGPLAVFGGKINPAIGREIQKHTQLLFYREFIYKNQGLNSKAYLTKKQQLVLYLYRVAAMETRADSVTNQVVQELGAKEFPEISFSRDAIKGHNRDIRKAFNSSAEGTPLNNKNFGTLREIAGFLNAMFGPPPLLCGAKK